MLVYWIGFEVVVYSCFAVFIAPGRLAGGRGLGLYLPGTWVQRLALLAAG